MYVAISMFWNYKRKKIEKDIAQEVLFEVGTVHA